MIHNSTRNIPPHAYRAVPYFLLFLLSCAAGTASALPPCPGDCDGDGRVTVAELTRGVRIALELSPVDACMSIDRDGDGAVSVAELIGAVRAALGPCGGGGRAIVLATDFVDGAFATIDLDTRAITPVSGRTLLHSDTTPRVIDGDVYVVNRFGGDSIQKLAGDDLETVYQCSTGPGSNPQDIVVIDDDKAYVSVFEEAALLIVDPTPEQCRSRDDFVTGSIDLSALADDDGTPDMTLMAKQGNIVYVALQRLDIASPLREPAANGAIAVIDATTDTVVDTIELTGKNPFATTKGLIIRGDSLYVSEVGIFGSNDGGIERVDLATRTPQGFLLSEETAGGDIVDFAFASATRAYAIVSRPDFTTALIAFDPAAGSLLATVDVADGFDYADIEVNPRGELYLADRRFDRPGLRVFRAVDGSELTAAPLDVGLPPTEVVFLP
jgi:DNA-binding beta-propeller fold protein YncE